MQPVLLDHREDAATHPAIRGAAPPARRPCTAEAVRAELAVVFLATPPEVSMELAPAMLDAGRSVVDLSGAFRLRTPENYAAWYKSPTPQPELLAEAVYGLPEFCRERIPARPPGGQSRAATPRPPTWPSGRWSKPASSTARPASCATPNRASAARAASPASRPASARSPRTSPPIPSSTTGTCPKCCRFRGLEEREFSFTAQLLPLDRGILETIYFRAPGLARRRGTARHLREALRRRAVRPPLQSRHRARPARAWRAPTSATSA